MITIEQILAGARLIRTEVKDKYKVHGIDQANADLMIKQLIFNLECLASAENSLENAVLGLERHLDKPKVFEFPKFDDDSALTKSLDFGETTAQIKELIKKDVI